MFGSKGGSAPPVGVGGEGIGARVFLLSFLFRAKRKDKKNGFYTARMYQAFLIRIIWYRWKRRQNVTIIHS
jgi:hypothetical protein